MPEATVGAPGLEYPFKAEAPVFNPGAKEYQLPGGSPASPGNDLFSTPSGTSTADGDPLDKATYQYMYNQLLYQYNMEVPLLRHQVLELTNKLAELDRWKQQTMGLVRDLRDQHRALRRKIGDDPAAPPLERTASSEAEQVLTRAKTLPPLCSPPPPPPDLVSSKSTPADSVPQEFDAETGLKVYKTKMDGVEAMRADWKVNHFSTKLRGAMGRPVVSAPFDLHGCEEVRLMITPEVQESNTGPRTRKEKEQFSKMVTDGPLIGCLTLKVPNSRPLGASAPLLLEYFLHVGDKRAGPFKCDFSNTAIDNRGSFKDAAGQGINWLLEMKDASVTVGVEMLPPPSTEAAEDVEMQKDEEMPPPPPGLGGMAPPAEAITEPSGV